MSCSSDVLGYDDFISLKNDFIGFQGSRRWSRDISAIEIVLPVVTSAPDKSHIFAILHSALEMRTDCRERPQLSTCCAYQKGGLIPEPEDESAVFRDILNLPDLNAVDFDSSSFWRLEIGKEGIKK
jgi:hypothetical protein